MKGNLKSKKQYIPINTEKYVGKYPIYIKSSWEEKFCQWLDYNNKVVEWSSESIRIPYIDPTKGHKYGMMDNRMGMKRSYYPDFMVKFNDGKRYLIEIKPEKQTRMPKKKGKKSRKTLIERERIYLMNQAKFKSAELFCKKMNMKFLVLTENELFIKK